MLTDPLIIDAQRDSTANSSTESLKTERNGHKGAALAFFGVRHGDIALGDVYQACRYLSNQPCQPNMDIHWDIKELFHTYTEAGGGYERESCDSMLVKMPEASDIKDITNNTELCIFA